jgi:erythromycin esterase-like protein
MAPAISAALADRVRDAAHLLPGDSSDHDALLELIGNARLTLIGEASHGTHEFYHERIEITKRLILERGLTGIAVEADWPDAYRVNRYVRWESEDHDADAALSGFERFPTWMWRNAPMLDFVEWLRLHNADLPAADRVGFYGIDLYSLFSSIEAVLTYLDQVDPEAARRARHRYGCFEHFGEDSQAYGYAASFDLRQSCEDDAVRQLVELRRSAAEYRTRDGHLGPDEFFAAEQNARLVTNAEQYYRSMFRGRASSWNLRDRHMAETLEALIAHLERHGRRAKLAVWAHNSHLGDARATEMGQGGELNVGQLVRERFGRDCVLVGFTTHHGTVTAASDWDSPSEVKRVRPGLPGSCEALFHDVDIPRFMIPLRESPIAAELRAPLLERAIGVIYRPETERVSHYFHARLADQFDALIHIDETRALEPLDQQEAEHHLEPPETYPTGI